MRKVAAPIALALALVALVFVMTVGLDQAQAAMPYPAASNPGARPPAAALGGVVIHSPIESASLLPATLILIGIIGRHAYKSARRLSQRGAAGYGERGAAEF